MEGTAPGCRVTPESVPEFVLEEMLLHAAKVRSSGRTRRAGIALRWDGEVIRNLLFGFKHNDHTPDWSAVPLDAFAEYQTE
jgi:hypothetical protein